MIQGEEEAHPFTFPKHYQPDIETGNQLKELTPKQQAKLYSRIANVMFLFKRYPTYPKEYQNVARQVLSFSTISTRSKCIGIVYK